VLQSIKKISNQGFCWELNAFLQKLSVILESLESISKGSNVKNFWELCSKPLVVQCHTILINFGCKIAIWNLSSKNYLDLSKFIDDKLTLQKVDTCWNSFIKGDITSDDKLKYFFKIEKKINVQFGDIKKISNEHRYALVFLCSIPEKLANAGTYSGGDMLLEVKDMIGIGDEVTQNYEQLNSLIQLTQKTKDTQYRLVNLKKALKEKKTSIDQLSGKILLLSTIFTGLEALQAFRGIHAEKSLIDSEEENLEENIHRYKIRYGEFEFTPEVIKAEKKNCSKKKEIFEAERDKMKIEIVEFESLFGSEEELTDSVNRLDGEFQKQNAKMQNLYHLYVNSNINAKIKSFSPSENDKEFKEKVLELLSKIDETTKLASETNISTLVSTQQIDNRIFDLLITMGEKLPSFQTS